MAQVNLIYSNRIATPPLTAMTADTLESLSEEDLKVALILANMQAGANFTMDDFDAALALIDLSASNTEEPTRSLHDVNNNSACKKDQRTASDDQRQERLEYLAAYQRQRRARLNIGDIWTGRLRLIEKRG